MFIITSRNFNENIALRALDATATCEKRLNINKYEFRISSKINRKFNVSRFNTLDKHNLPSVTKQCDPSSQTKQKIPLTQQNKRHTVCAHIASCINDYMFELNNKSPGWRSRNGFGWCGLKITTF